MWQEGILSNLLKQSEHQHISNEWMMRNVDEKRKRYLQDTPSMIQKWVVLDGDICKEWADGLYAMLTNGHNLTLANAEKIHKHGRTF